MKRAIAVLLSVCIFLSCTVTAFAEKVGDSPYGTTIPTIYVEGANAPLSIWNEDGTRGRDVYPLELGKDKIMSIVKENIGIFAKAFFTQKWDDFCVMLARVMSDLMADIRLDENGKAPNNSSVKREWALSTISKKTFNGKYPVDQYKLHYDWRVDPYESADRLHNYIEAVMLVTGVEKVNVVSRCYGVCVAAAYMEKYEGEHVAEWIIYNSAAGGVTYCTKPFSGEIWLSGDGIERFGQDLSMIADESLRAILESFITMLGKTCGLDIAAWAVNNVYKDIYMQIIPPVLTQTYGTFPGYWAMVSVEDYEKAKETVFYGADMEKWANFIRIIDNYHNNVKTKMPEIIEKCQKNGIEVSNIVKYGFQNLPVIRDKDVLSDGTCAVSLSSMGATTSTLLGTLDADYIARAVQNGTDKYLSPDLQIDASTCFLPETTWFIKDLSHKIFPHSVEELIAEIFDTDGMTIETNARFPQYMVYTEADDALHPMTKDNCDTTARYRRTYFSAFGRFWKSLFRFLWQKIFRKEG